MRRPFAASLAVIVCIVALACLCSCGGSGDRTGAAGSLLARAEDALALKDGEYGRRAAGLVAAMSDAELAGQVLMVGVGGAGTLPAWSRDSLAELKPGAVILFGFNVPAELSALASALGRVKEAAAVRGLAPFVAIDHEGGSVMRIRNGVTPLPEARLMGRGGAAVASAAGTAAGSELRALGISMNLAPVVEALSDSNRAFLSSRAWSDDPASAAGLSGAFLTACQEAGVAAVAKHFPGNAGADPHERLPVLAAGRPELEAAYFPPFREAARRRAAAVMLSHVMVPALDEASPVSLSAPAIAVLKRGLGFEGIVMTDDLVMAALSGAGGVGASAVRALAAGADMLMVSGGPGTLAARDAVLAALADGSLPRERLVDAARRVVAQKLRFGLDAEPAPSPESLPALVEANARALAAALDARAR